MTESILYREIIMDHYKNPRNKGIMRHPDGSAERDNPLCGDRIVIAYKLDGKKKKLLSVKFEGTGCSLTRAGASMLTEFVKGKTIKELAVYTDGDFIADMGVPITPARKKCALLALEALRTAVGIEKPLIRKTSRYPK
ncbi:MAG: iron-sulfur cluster assembly scaffold protein [Patescibacteria group bacterium]|nr:iron-sulfur cluster assembly scaffold protein [Patescibacteria group bacterium]MDD5715738.1 iron-sulfur cluster assembly scaffold protein [Patescibacteria group bacterium]